MSTVLVYIFISCSTVNSNENQSGLNLKCLKGILANRRRVVDFLRTNQRECSYIDPIK